MAHNDYVVKKQSPGQTEYECGCVFINGTCAGKNMCEEGREIGNKIKAFLTNTEEGRARVAEVRREAGLA